ncbi:MAG: hypothetical protein IKP65_01990 [Alphaproteobacteria bacterium]|nr:hypothetical protein [Alphaproteobacteria bacterium]
MYEEKLIGSKEISFVIVILLIGMVFAFVRYTWTKSSVEDLTGKEVKPTTVLWIMSKERR